MPRTSLINWEKGVSMPVDMLIPLREKFGLNINWFLTGEGEMQQIGNDSNDKNPAGNSSEALKTIANQIIKVAHQIDDIPTRLKPLLKDLNALSDDDLKLIQGQISILNQKQTAESYKQSERENRNTRAG